MSFAPCSSRKRREWLFSTTHTSSPVHELGEVNDDLFMTMEYVNGFDLKTMLREAHNKGLKLPLDLAVYIGARVASALDFAFTREGPDGRPLQIVHRDVSPANIMISFAGTVKLTDFGHLQAVFVHRGAQTRPSGTTSVHESGAGRGRPPRRPIRHLLVGRHPLRNDRGPKAFRGQSGHALGG
jgi:serine/threonine protein kinase